MKIKIRQHWQVLIALALGIVSGISFPSMAPWVGWAGDVFVNALCLLIVPIIFFSVSNGLISVISSSPDRLKSLGAKTIGLYVLTMAMAIFVGLVLVMCIQPGSGVDVSLAQNSAASAVENRTVSQIIVGFVPSNFVWALAHNNTMPVIFLAVLVGVFLPKVSDREGKNALLNLMKGGYELTMKMTEFIIKFAPVGVFAISLKQFSMVADVWGLFAGMARYVLTVALGLAIQTFIILPAIMRFGFRLSAGRHFRNVTTPLITAFATASSGAALPLSIAAVKENDKVSSKVADFVIPLGSTINMNGAALLECVAVIFIAQAYGISLDVMQIVIITITSLVCAIGSAGIPMSAMVMMVLILNAVGLPPEGIGLVIGVDRILDMMRTAVNVYGDTCVAAMVAKSEGEELAIGI